MRHTSPIIHRKVTSHLLIQQNSYEACSIGQTLGTRKMRNAPASSLRPEGDPTSSIAPRPQTQGSTQLPRQGPGPGPSRPDPRPPPTPPTPLPPARLSAGRQDTGPSSSDSISAMPPRLRQELSSTSIHLPHGPLNPEQWRPLNRSPLGRVRLAEKRLAGVSQQTPAR